MWFGGIFLVYLPFGVIAHLPSPLKLIVIFSAAVVPA